MDAAHDLIACATQSWHERFQDVSFKSILIPLPPEFVDWVVEDGIVLPETNRAIPTRTKIEIVGATEDDYQDWSSDDEDQEAHVAPPDFTDLLDTIKTAIEELGGSVAPKFTWSTPKDALWMNNNTLRCTNPDEVLLLLKSSDRVADDVCHALEEVSLLALDGDNANTTTINTDKQIDHTLVLRKWYDLQPGREFRCFVKNNTLIAISQRDVTQRFDFLATEHTDLKARILAFHQQHIANGAFHTTSKSFTYDVYIPTSPTARVRLMDFGVAGGTTAPLLFTWEELYQDDDDDDNSSINEQQQVEFRFINEEVPIRPAGALYGVPFDFVDDSDGSALNKLLSQYQTGSLGPEDKDMYQ